MKKKREKKVLGRSVRLSSSKPEIDRESSTGAIGGGMKTYKRRIDNDGEKQQEG